MAAKTKEKETVVVKTQGRNVLRCRKTFKSY